jgi:hypothetical protein
MDISNSEIEAFLRCRRMWNFESYNRMNLRTKGPIPHLAFYVGDICHRILEAQILEGHRPDIAGIVGRAEQEAEDRYRELVGVGWSSDERDLLNDSRDLVTGIMNHYFNHWGAINPLGDDFEYLHAEVTFRVQIPGTEHHLLGTIDGIARHESGELYLVEHKTTSVGFPKPEELQIARQLQLYTWAARILYGKPISGVVYDGILKKVPVLPRVLKDGSLSRQAVATTPALFRKAIQVLNLNEADYEDVISNLRDDYFFRRYTIRFTQKSLDLFGEQLRAVVTDMANPELPLYPNVSWQGCWDCRFRDLCAATQMGEDVSPLIELNYRAADPAPSRRKEAIESFELGREEDYGLRR